LSPLNFILFLFVKQLADMAACEITYDLSGGTLSSTRSEGGRKSPATRSDIEIIMKCLCCHAWLREHNICAVPCKDFITWTLSLTLTLTYYLYIARSCWRCC